MAKRFTDTEKWKKGFLRGLQGPYKLLWFYILDDCDMAGIWQVDMEVARIRIGEQVDRDTAVRLFGDRIRVFDNGKKWFISDFIFFQYGELKETNRMHAAVMKTLKSNNIDFQQGASEGLPSPQGQGQGQGKRQGNGQGQGSGGVGDFEYEWKAAFDEKTLENLGDQFKHLDLTNELTIFRLKCDGDPADYHSRTHGSLRTAFLYQLKNSKGNQTAKARRADPMTL